MNVQHQSSPQAVDDSESGLGNFCVGRRMRTRSAFALAAILIAIINWDLAPVQASSAATIGSVVIGTRSGAEVGLSSQVSLPTISFCITFTTTDQAMDYGYEVVDALGARPPYGSAFSSAFTFVPTPDWNSGKTLPPRVVCNTTTLERDKSYTVRAWVTSGPYESRGSWALSSSAAPLAATYIYSPTNITTTISGSTTVPSSGGSGSGGSQCPSSLPVRIAVGGASTCISLQQQCASNPNWSDVTKGLKCPGTPASPSETSTTTPACSAVLFTPMKGRVRIRFVSSLTMPSTSVRFDVQRGSRWYSLATGRFSTRRVATVSTSTAAINGPREYRFRAVRARTILCTGSLVVPTRLNLKGAMRPV